MESMSNAPYLLPAARKGFRMGDSVAVDSMIHDGLWCAIEDFHMGMTAELVADKFSITRAQQDAYALESHRRAAAAQREGRFTVEITSVTLPANSSSRNYTSARAILAPDESVREDASLEALAALQIGR